MEALSQVLQPYKNAIAFGAEAVTMLQMFSGVFICWDIYKQKSTKGNDVMPFLFGLVIGVLDLNYGIVLNDAALVEVNIYGLILSLAYLAVYVKYEKDPGPLWKKIGIASGICAVVMVYTRFEDPDLVEDRFGMFMMTVMMCMIGQSLFALKDAIKNKCTETLPFPIIFSGTVVFFMWMLHALAQNNEMMFWQYFLIFCVLAFQLSFFCIYPSRREDDDDSKKKED